MKGVCCKCGLFKVGTTKEDIFYCVSCQIEITGNKFK